MLVLHRVITQNFAIYAPGNRMTLVVVGINHRTAPVEVRERVVFEPSRVPDALRDLVALDSVAEAVIVSTCNRTEIYCVTRSGDGALADWLQRYHGLGSSIRHCLYHHDELRAVAHVFARRLGPRLHGARRAADPRPAQGRLPVRAGGRHAPAPMLNRLFQAAFCGRQARAHRDRRSARTRSRWPPPPSSMAKTVFASFENRTALMVGAGETIELAARHLHADGLRRMIVANRSIDRARELADEFQGFAIGLDDIARAPARGRHRDRLHGEPDAVIITREMAQQALRARKHRPIFMVDIAVPRDIEPAVAELEDVYLYTVDDLQSVVNENMESRRQAAREADTTDRRRRSIASTCSCARSAPRRPSARLRERGRAHARQHARAGAAHARRRPQPEDVLEFLSTRSPTGCIHAPSQRAARGRRER